jgi:hypothetical protein
MQPYGHLTGSWILGNAFQLKQLATTNNLRFYLTELIPPALTTVRFDDIF